MEGPNSRTSPRRLSDSAHDNPNDALGSKRKTVCVPVGGMWYEVGPDVALCGRRLLLGRNHHDDYIRTEYRAFTAGGPSFHEGRQGRPAGARTASGGLRAAGRNWQKAMTENSRWAAPYGRGQTVLVVAQPRGPCMPVFGDQANAKLRHGRTLVIDAGSRTFDWLVTLDSKGGWQDGDSVNRG